MSNWSYSSSLYLCFLGAMRWMSFLWCFWRFFSLKNHCFLRYLVTEQKCSDEHCMNILAFKESYLLCNKKNQSPPLLKLGTSIITWNHDRKVVSQRRFPGTKGLGYHSKNFHWKVVQKYSWIRWSSGTSYKTKTQKTTGLQRSL